MNYYNKVFAKSRWYQLNDDMMTMRWLYGLWDDFGATQDVCEWTIVVIYRCGGKIGPELDRCPHCPFMGKKISV